MTREEKHELVAGLAEKLRAHKSFYLVDISGFTVEKTSEFRRKLFENNLELQMVKNKLIQKALEQVDGDFSPLFHTLKESTCVLFVNDSDTLPAKVIKEFKADAEKPSVKAAYLQETVFVGGANLVDELAVLKGKNELLGEVIGLLQSPAQNVLSALTGQGGKIAGILKTLEEKKSA